MSEVVLRWLDKDGVLKTAASGSKADIDAAFSGGASWTWADVTDPEEHTFDDLSARFGFHELTSSTEPNSTSTRPGSSSYG